MESLRGEEESSVDGQSRQFKSDRGEEPNTPDSWTRLFPLPTMIKAQPYSLST